MTLHTSVGGTGEWTRVQCVLGKSKARKRHLSAKMIDAVFKPVW